MKHVASFHGRRLKYVKRTAVMVARERDTASITSRDNRVIITIGQTSQPEVRLLVHLPYKGSTAQSNGTVAII
jgi:hypothetical protein